MLLNTDLAPPSVWHFFRREKKTIAHVPLALPYPSPPTTRVFLGKHTWIPTDASNTNNTMAGHGLDYDGCNFFRQRLVLSTLSGKRVKIQGIRWKEDDPGLRGESLARSPSLCPPAPACGVAVSTEANALAVTQLGVRLVNRASGVGGAEGMVAGNVGRRQQQPPAASVCVCVCCCTKGDVVYSIFGDFISTYASEDRPKFPVLWPEFNFIDSMCSGAIRRKTEITHSILLLLVVLLLLLTFNKLC